MSAGGLLSAQLGRPCFPPPLLAAIRLLYSTPVQRAETVSLLPWRRWGRGGRGVLEGGDVVKDTREVEELRLERFIPVTRRSLVRRLGEEEGLLNWQERQKLETFASALDARFSQRLQGILEETKVCLMYQ